MSLLLLNPHKLLVAVGISLIKVVALWTEVPCRPGRQMLSIREPDISLVHHHLVVVVVVKAEARSCSLIELLV